VDAPSTVDEAFLRGLPIEGWEVLKAAEQTEMLPLPSFVTWKLRLAVERGLLTPATVNTVALPEGVSETLETVWRGFVHLCSVRWAMEPGVPAPFGRVFAASWCGVTERQAKEAIAELRKMGYLRLEDVQTKGARRIALYLPREAA
jgi:hypothetical protein